MPAPTVEVNGARDLRRALRLAGVKLDQDALKKAHLEAAEIVARQARYEVPVDTGKLAGTIRAAGTKTKGVVRAGFARVPYAGPIHFGWPARNIAPQPFLYEAADQRVAEVVVVYGARVREIAAEITSSTT